MAINLPGVQRFDSRGLPEGYDPHNLYEYRQETLVKNSAGLESFLYRYIPLSVVRSLAFAIDPTYAFKVAPMPITSANRTKYRQTASATNHRRSVRRFKRYTYGQIPNYQNVQICWSPYAPETHLSIPDQIVSKPGQPPLPAYLKDTTSRTRLIGSTQGTLELFKGDLISPSRYVYRSTTDKAFFAPGSLVPNALLSVEPTIIAMVASNPGPRPLSRTVLCCPCTPIMPFERARLRMPRRFAKSMQYQC